MRAKHYLLGVGPTSIRIGVDSMIYNLLPLLEGWSYEPIETTAEPIRRGRPREFAKDYSRGWLIRAYMKTDHPDVRMRIALTSAVGRQTLWGQATMLNAFGWTLPNHRYFWCSLYDAQNDEYVVVYAPVQLWPCRNLLEVEVEIPAGSAVESATINELKVDRIKIVDEEAFKKSLKVFVR